MTDDFPQTLEGLLDAYRDSVAAWRETYRHFCRAISDPSMSEDDVAKARAAEADAFRHKEAWRAALRNADQ